MRSVTFLVVVLIVAPLASPAAQEAPSLTSGDRVRVTYDCSAACREDRGTVDAVKGDSIVLSTEQDQSRVVILLASITRLSVVRGQKSHWAAGSVIGGVALGAATAGVIIGFCDPWGNSPNCSPTTGAIVGLTAAGAAVGAAIGAGLGSLVKSDRWEEVPLDQLRVSFVPHGRGLVVGISAAF